MGLFINSNEHQNVYKNTKSIDEPNQLTLKRDYLKEILEEQQRVNSSLRKSYNEIKLCSQERELQLANQWNDVSRKLKELNINNLQHKDFESKMINLIKALDEKNVNLQVTLEKESLIKQAIFDHMNLQGMATQEIAVRMEKYEVGNDNLTLQMKQQIELHKKIADKLTAQEDFQTGVLTRLDKQEALTEKIARQLNHIRSILFERTNYLAEKVEEGYKLTSSYVYHLMAGADQPLKNHFTSEKKEHNKS